MPEFTVERWRELYDRAFPQVSRIDITDWYYGPNPPPYPARPR